METYDAFRAPDATTHLAAIVDIDTLASAPGNGLFSCESSVEELTCRGPSDIMNDTKQHGANVRWIHLRANNMAWVEAVMAGVCRERGLPISEASETLSTNNNPILRTHLWTQLFHGKASKQIQSRSMVPTGAQFFLNLEDEESDSNHSTGATTRGKTRGSAENLVLYAPFLHWESYTAWIERQELLQAISEHKAGKPQPDREMVAKYLHHTAPLHDRRSLHQAYYHDFGMIKSLPKYEQVMQRFTAQTDSDSVKVMVVDQLWLWVIKGTGAAEGAKDTSHPDLVVTAFPDRFNGAHDTANVYQSIIEHLKRGLQPRLRGAIHLVAAILDHCTGVFFEKQLEHDKWFVEFFAAAIGTVVSGRQILLTT